MGEPINIKTKKIIPQRSNFQFEKNIVLESLEQNIISHLNTWVKFQFHSAFRIFLKCMIWS